MKLDRALAAVRQELAARSYRITTQRMAIIKEFAGLRRYVTARELFKRIGSKRAGIGLATIYRTLEALLAIGAASALPHARGETAYLFCAVDHHHHAVCTKCGKVDDVPCRLLSRLERSLTADLQFKLTQHRLEFFGICARCS
jgi:Fur family ferric uptake transcriptional regulator